MLGSLTSYTINHIYRDANKEADKLSKEGLDGQCVVMNYKLSVDRHMIEEGVIHLLSQN